MDKLNYCLDCKKIFNFSDHCSYCNSSQIKMLEKKSPVNVIGTKLKGRVFDSKEGKVQLLFVDEKKEKTIKEYDASKIKKIL